MNTPRVLIIVLNWNGKEDTVECLESLKGLTYPNHQVVIVDNASTDGSQDIFKRDYPEFTLIENSANLGFSAGNNVGIRYALENGADYVFLLNNDTVVEPSFLTAVVEVAQKDESIGIVTPLAHFYDHPERVQIGPLSFNFYSGHPHPGRIDKRKTVWDTDVAFGACMLIKRKVLERAGLLSTDYQLGWEDIDFTYNARRLGFRAVILPSARIWHKGSVSLDKVSDFRIRVSVVNRFIFLYRYSTRFQFFCSTAWFLFVEVPANMVSFSVRYHSLRAPLSLFQGMKQALFHLMRHRKELRAQ